MSDSYETHYYTRNSSTPGTVTSARGQEDDTNVLCDAAAALAADKVDPMGDGYTRAEVYRLTPFIGDAGAGATRTLVATVRVTVVRPPKLKVWVP